MTATEQESSPRTRRGRTETDGGLRSTRRFAGYSPVEHGHQPRSDVRLRRANQPRAHAPHADRGQQPPRESAPSRLTARVRSAISPSSRRGSPPARALRGRSRSADALDRAQREQSEVDVAAEIERRIAVAVGRLQEWRAACCRYPLGGALGLHRRQMPHLSSADAPDTPLSPLARGKRPGLRRSRVATPPHVGSLAVRALRNDAKRDHGLDDRPDAGARATRRARSRTGRAVPDDRRHRGHDRRPGRHDRGGPRGAVHVAVPGRPDVFATRWESTKTPGKSGWAPRCLNEWRPGVCDKPKVKCADCANRRFVAWSDAEARRHLEGRQTAGIYPLLADETCWLVAIDLDGPGWREDVERAS